jgi:hypothetical protein
MRTSRNPTILNLVFVAAGAGAAVAAVMPASLGVGGPARAPGFVLLSMEQAAMFHGAQVPGYCTGTGVYTACFGEPEFCWMYSTENCPPFARNYSNATIHYCMNWVPGPPPGACTFVSRKTCYVDNQCQATDNGCVHPMWPLGYENEVELNDDICTAPTPPLPPPGGG